MSATEAVDALQRLGLSKYEAEVFVALQRVEVGTARDVAELADVPRSQVYGAADDLAERGLVDVQQSSPKRYRAVSLEAARERLRRAFEREQERAFGALEALESRVPATEERKEQLWTLTGSDTVSSRVEELVREAEEEVVYGSEHDLLDEDLIDVLTTAASDTSVTVASTDPATIAAVEDTPIETIPLPPEIEPDELPVGRFLVVDGETILMGMIDPDGEETAFWSSGTAYAAAEIRLVDGWLGDHLEI